MNVNLNVKQINFMKRYSLFGKVYIFLILVILGIAAVQYFLVYKKILTSVYKLSDKAPEVYRLVNFIIAKLYFMNIFWISLLIGAILGSLYGHYKMKGFFKNVLGN